MISVLLSTYNGEKYIRESIDSVLSQDQQEFELLIGLNGTTDRTRDILNGYTDPRIRIFDFGSDKGKGKTLNKLLKESKYSFVAIQDDDDVWLPNKISSQIKYIEMFDVVGSRIRYIDERGGLLGIPLIEISHFNIVDISMRGDNQVPNTSAIFNKSKAVQIGGWREDIDGIEDYDFWLRLMRNGCKFFNHPDILVHHRLHDRSNFNINKYDIKKIL